MLKLVFDLIISIVYLQSLLFISELGVFLSLILSLFERRRLDIVNTNLIEQIERLEDRIDYLEEIRDDLYS